MTENIEKVIADKYCNMAFALGWTLSHAARMVRISPGHYSNVVTGKRRATPIILRRMQEVYQKHISYVEKDIE